MGRSVGFKCECGAYPRYECWDGMAVMNCNGCGWNHETGEKWDPAKHEIISNSVSDSSSSSKSNFGRPLLALLIIGIFIFAGSRMCSDYGKKQIIISQENQRQQINIQEQERERVRQQEELPLSNPERKSTEVVVESRPSAPVASEIGRDGRFIAYDNGTVLDTITNRMWAAKDNGYDINWADAKTYCENYHRGGYKDWRMPTMAELDWFYDAHKSRVAACDRSNSIHFATELIDISCFCVWAAETNGPNAAGGNYKTGGKGLVTKSYSKTIRAIPVRFVK